MIEVQFLKYTSFKSVVEISSLHNIIFNSIQLVLVLWRLLHQGFPFLSYILYWVLDTIQLGYK